MAIELEKHAKIIVCKVPRSPVYHYAQPRGGRGAEAALPASLAAGRQGHRIDDADVPVECLPRVPRHRVASLGLALS